MKSSIGSLMGMNNNSKSYVAAILVQCINAGLALFSKAAVARGMNPFVFVVYRQAVATIFLAPFAFFMESQHSAPLSFNLLCKIFLVALCGLTLCLNGLVLALKYVPATLAAAGMNTVPCMTFAMAVCFRMERLSVRQWHGQAKLVGCVLCLLGAIVTGVFKGPPVYSTTKKGVEDTFTSGTSKGDWIKGSLILLLGYALWSLWLIIQGPIMKQYPAKLRLITLQCFFSFIQSAVLAVAMERNISSWKLGWDVNLASVLFCGVVVTGFGYWLRIYVIENKGPVFIAAFTPLALIFAAIVSAILWKEVFYWGSVCGAILLVGGLYGVLWGKHKEGKDKTSSEQRLSTKEEATLESIITTQK